MGSDAPPAERRAETRPEKKPEPEKKAEPEKKPEPLDLPALVAKPASEAAVVTRRFEADRGSLTRAYPVPFSATRNARLAKFYSDWLAALKAVEAEKVSPEAREELADLRSKVESGLRELEAAAAAMREAMRDTVKRYSLWYLLQGILMVVAGVLALVYPLIASVAIVYLLAWILIISGVVQGIGLIGAQQVPHFWLQLISVVLSIVVGLLLLRQPEAGLVVFSVLLIVYFMVEGMAKVIFALTIRPFPNWGWLLAAGLVSIALAVYLWANLSVVSEWLLGFLLGIQLLVEGVALTYLAWRVRES